MTDGNGSPVEKRPAASPKPASDSEPSLADYRRTLVESETRAWDHFDDLVFKISAGSLVISVTFIGTVKLTSPGHTRASYPEDQAAVTSAHTVNDRARSIR